MLKPSNVVSIDARKLLALVQFREVAKFGRYCRALRSYPGYEAMAACQISGIVAVLPLMTTAAVWKLFNPGIGRSRCCFTRR